MDLNTLNDTPPWEWPEDAAVTILASLRDEQADASERLLAAELAGDTVVVDDELADALLSMANNDNEVEALRGQAAISLGPCLEQTDIDEFEDPDDALISEEMFQRVQETLRELYANASTPDPVRRRVLEASVRAPQDWHKDAIRAAFSSNDESWKLTAVFCMRFVRGFNDQILEALESENEDIYYEAVRAAGNWEAHAAWPHILSIITGEGTDKPLLLAAIEAAAGVNPHEAMEVLVDLADSDDEDIVEAVDEAMIMAEGLLDNDEYDRSLN